MRFARFVLALTALIYTGLAVASLLFPWQVAAKVGIQLSEVIAVNDFRAVYGGMNAGIALFLWVAVLTELFFRAGLLLNLLLFTGLAGGRAASWFYWDGDPGMMGYILFGTEVLGFLLAWIALFTARPRKLSTQNPLAAMPKMPKV